MGRFPFPASPVGWFAVASSDEVRPGTVIPVSAFGRELVVWRAGDGMARVADAYCPHLGAHLGHDARVEGANLVCPFHGWCYDLGAQDVPRAAGLLRRRPAAHRDEEVGPRLIRIGQSKPIVRRISEKQPTGNRQRETGSAGHCPLPVARCRLPVLLAETGQLTGASAVLSSYFGVGFPSCRPISRLGASFHARVASSCACRSGFFG